MLPTACSLVLAPTAAVEESGTLTSEEIVEMTAEEVRRETENKS